MKTNGLVLAVVLAFCSLGMAQAADEKKTITSVVDGTVKTIEGELVPAVEAMPEDKFGFAPTNGEFKGVRTFAQQAKHVAAVNYIVAAAILGEKPPVDTGGEKGPDSVASKGAMRSRRSRIRLAKAPRRGWEWALYSPGMGSITTDRWWCICGRTGLCRRRAGRVAAGF